MRDITGENRSITIASIENFSNPEDNFPMLKIAYNCDGRERHNYLMPFRLYKFQVCSTADGQSDDGSCQVVGLANILRANYRAVDPEYRAGYQSNCGMRSTAVECLYGLAMSALNDFSQRNDIFIDMPRHFYELKNGDRIYGDLVRAWLYDEVVPYIEEHTDIY